MKVLSTETRHLQTEQGEIIYTFERKNIKNINLRVRWDDTIYVSAPAGTSVSTADAFVIRKSAYIRKALVAYSRTQPVMHNMQYVSGESITILGRDVRIKVEKNNTEFVACDGVYVFINVKRPDYYNRKKNLLQSWIEEQSTAIFSEIVREVHNRFAPYNVDLPQVSIRNMSSRWGSCQVKKGIIVLNKRLIEAPRSCIEYVVYHEFCHFIFPNHSRQFYLLLQTMMPNWRETKDLLEESVTL